MAHVTAVDPGSRASLYELCVHPCVKEMDVREAHLRGKEQRHGEEWGVRRVSSRMSSGRSGWVRRGTYVHHDTFALFDGHRRCFGGQEGAIKAFGP